MNLRAILALGATILASSTATVDAETVNISSEGQLKTAVAKAKPGDIIMLMPGLYQIDRIAIAAPGTADRPILLSAPSLGDVKIVPRDEEAFKIAAPYWTFENLDIGGGPSTDHAFHIVGAASHVIIRHNFLHDLNAMIKGNGEGQPRVFPNDVLIESNVLLNAAARAGDAPVTPIDVVGGRGWVIRNNFIADFGKAGGNQVSYGAFLKGNSSDGVLERNLILCEWKTHGGVRIGLSLGGGGTDAGLCDGDSCATEHRRGTIRNNIVANCPEDVGIYLNKAQDTKVLSNTLFNTNGIDIRFPASSAQIDANIVSGGLRSRDGGILSAGDNLVFGARASTIEHKSLLWLEEEILGASKKYPSIFRGDWAAWLAGRSGPVDQADNIIGTSFLGRGRAGMAMIFEDSLQGDFALNPTEGNVSVAPAPDVIDDFCGFPRDAQRPSIGAIELRDENCYVPLMMLRAESLIIMDRRW